MTGDGTKRRWAEGSQIEGLCHLGLAMVAETDPSQSSAALQEFDASLDSLNCGGWTQGIDCAPLRQSVFDHIKTTHPEMLVELDRLRQERERQRAVEASLGTIWSPVEQAADSIAQKMWVVEYETLHLGEAQPAIRRVSAQQIQGTQLLVSTMVRQSFCPAKKAFVAKAGPAEFLKRAGAHCKDHAPEGSAQGHFYAGAASGSVLLTKQCQAALASSCP